MRHLMCIQQVWKCDYKVTHVDRKLESSMELFRALVEVEPSTNRQHHQSETAAIPCYSKECGGLVADRTGLEPATSAVTGRHSNQLNYQSDLPHFSMERVQM